MPILAATVISREIAELRRTLLILRALAVHDVLEFGMACHGSLHQIAVGLPRAIAPNFGLGAIALRKAVAQAVSATSPDRASLPASSPFRKWPTLVKPILSQRYAGRVGQADAAEQRMDALVCQHLDQRADRCGPRPRPRASIAR
jgi:hypothetical protein